jgi:DNA polymerase-1
MRRQAKVLNFGIIYGMGVLGFAHAAGVPRQMAQKFIDEYFTRFSGVARYMEETKEQAFRDGWVSTLFGRRRVLPDITSRIPQLAAQAERMAINHPIQGTGADLVKMAMVAADTHIRKHYTDGSVRMLLQVHDELVFEVTKEKAETVGRELKALMEQVASLDVPLVIDVKSGPTWSDMKELE